MGRLRSGFLAQGYRRETQIKQMPNQITGANAGGRRLLLMRTRWAARVAQFCR
jgi:hypothetical protein